jgi:hypothetical protein
MVKKEGKMKRKYQKPEVKKVNLVPSEAVLVVCKVSMTAAGGGRRCAENNCATRDQGS